MIIYDWTSGSKYGSLMLTGKSYVENHRRIVETICKCGTVKWIRFDSIKGGSWTSCGCGNKTRFLGKSYVRKHGLSTHPLYSVYAGMKERCYDERHEAYKHYGGRGVRVAEIWLNDFMAFYNWALPKWQKGLDLDKDILWCEKFGGTRGMLYSPEFCCFVTKRKNASRRTDSVIIEYAGVKKTATEWSEDERCLVSVSALKRRVKKGWSAEKAMTTICRDKEERRNDSKRVRQITAWNETKSLIAWSEDKRCNTGYSGLKYRLKMGWSPEQAISLPFRPKVK